VELHAVGAGGGEPPTTSSKPRRRGPRVPRGIVVSEKDRAWGRKLAEEKGLLRAEPPSPPSRGGGRRRGQGDADAAPAAAPVHERLVELDEGM
jgi:hypothetical protein